LSRVCQAETACRSSNLSPKNDVTFRRHYLRAGSHKRETDFTDTAAIIKTQGRVLTMTRSRIGSSLGGILCSVCALAVANAQELTRAEMRSLDEQVQEIKTDVLGIAADLTRLEEKLLYPSNTQVAIFVSIAEGETFRLDSMQIAIDGALATHYLYGFKELEALQRGGVQRVYTGNVPTGSHEIAVVINGKTPGGDDFSSNATFSFDKGVEPKLLGIALNGPAAIDLGEW
jgi:hypothetical protein